MPLRASEFKVVFSPYIFSQPKLQPLLREGVITDMFSTLGDPQTQKDWELKTRLIPRSHHIPTDYKTLESLRNYVKIGKI